MKSRVIWLRSNESCYSRLFAGKIKLNDEQRRIINSVSCDIYIAEDDVVANETACRYSTQFYCEDKNCSSCPIHLYHNRS